MGTAPPLASGVRHLRGYLGPAAQAALVETIWRARAAAPFRRYVTPGGQPMSVAMTSFGPLGWVSDRRGYRYSPVQPESGAPWPPMPLTLERLWAELACAEHPADSCLINLYRDGARMGLHQDRDEADFRFPVLSISLGSTARFRIGGTKRRDPTRTLALASGDVLILAGPARLAFHGVDRLMDEGPPLVPEGGRINLTMRRAAPADEGDCP